MSRDDPRGDPDTRRPTDWFVPSTDITGATIAYDPGTRSLEFTIRFADLRELEHDGQTYGHSITLSNAAQAMNLYLTRHPRQGVTLVTRSVPSHPHFGGLIEPCDGATTSIDVDADLAVITTPRRCIAPRGAEAPFTAWTSSMWRAPGGRMKPLAQDQVELVRPVKTR